MLKRINTLLGSLWRQLGPKAAGRRAFVSDLLRFPVRREAETLVDAVPQVSLEQLMEMFGSARLVLAPGGRERHSWGLPALESSALLVLLEALSPSRVFEIGTFDGGTTALLAERTPDYCEVLTLDLPDSDFEATQFPPDFDSSKIGHLHRESHG
ncbi:MAG: hypothetical protein KGR47_05770, partial [Acidobacteria bacterium]|nr:hypothetical protein [Acidobacteriota bacterium]